MVYTEPHFPSPRVHVRVLAYITKPEERTSVVSNEFTFSFAVNADAHDGEAVVRHVIPTTVAAAENQLQVMDDIETADFTVGLQHVKPGEVM